MRKVVQYLAILTLAFTVAISCDSMTGSDSGITNESSVVSKTNDLASNASTTIVVSGDTFDSVEYSGWLFNRDPSTQSPYTFTFDEASIGNGSLYVEPITNDINGNSDKFIGELHLDEAIADIGSISYDFLIGNGGTVSDANHFYLNVYANFGESDFDKFYDCRYDVVPSTGSTSDWTTITFDPTQSYSVRQSSSSPQICPSVPANMDDESPGSTIRVAALNVGDTSGNDDGLDGYYDNVVVARTNGTTVYDFEPGPTVKSDCKKGGWEDFGFKNQGQCIKYVNTGKDSR